MNESPTSAEVHLDNQGQLAIPAKLRQSLGFAEGDRLIAREEAGRLILEKREAIARRLKARFSHVNPHRSLADELIAERREAAKAENVE